MRINFKIVFRTIGFILILLGTFMWLPLAFGIYYQEKDCTIAFLISALICYAIGFPSFYFIKGKNKFAKREGYLIVSLSWFAMVLFSTIPYLLSLDINFANAFFESSSGLTTTGATIFNDVEALPKSILIWRSLSQWIGGMGIIVFTVAIFPILGIGGEELFFAEAPGPTNQKLKPRIQDVAKRLWFIYLALTLILFLLLFYACGITSFDAINHAFTIIATGGFSTKTASIGHFQNPLMDYITIIFIIISSLNYTLLYFFYKGKFKRVFSNNELQFFLGFLAITILISTTILYFNSTYSLEEAFRHNAFSVVSVVTTTGFITTDYTLWGNPASIFFFILFFIGGCAGSTTGGIKIIRHMVFIKNGLLEFKRILHPRAFIRLKIDGQLVSGATITHILVFLLFYFITFIIGSVVMSFFMDGFEQPLISSLAATATCLGNVGISIADFRPSNTFAPLSDFPKVFLGIIMIIGRLEIFTVLILFTSYFWKNN